MGPDQVRWVDFSLLRRPAICSAPTPIKQPDYTLRPACTQLQYRLDVSNGGNATILHRGQKIEPRMTALDLGMSNTAAMMRDFASSGPCQLSQAARSRGVRQSGHPGRARRPSVTASLRTVMAGCSMCRVIDVEGGERPCGIAALQWQQLTEADGRAGQQTDRFLTTYCWPTAQA